MTSKTKHYLIYFEPPPFEISKKIEGLNNIISERYGNKYNSFVEGLWRSHLMVYLSPMPYENEDKIIEVVEKISKDLKSFEVELQGFSKGDRGYVFVDVDNKTQEILSEIRIALIDKLLPYRDFSIKQKYLDMWDDFSEQERENIKKTGIPYSYKAHMTVAQVSEKNCDGVLDLIKNKSLKGVKFIASEIKILSFYKGSNEVIANFNLLS